MTASWTGLLALWLLAVATTDGFSFTPSSCSSMRQLSRVASSPAGLDWRRESVPAGYAEASNLMTSALLEALTAPGAGAGRLLSVDMLTPGLNPKLEQKAILSQEQLFDLVRSLIPALGSAGRFRQVALMFPSMGDAAGYQVRVAIFELYDSLEEAPPPHTQAHLPPPCPQKYSFQVRHRVCVAWSPFFSSTMRLAFRAGALCVGPPGRGLGA